jgi:hypothetical protein
VTRSIFCIGHSAAAKSLQNCGSKAVTAEPGRAEEREESQLTLADNKRPTIVDRRSVKREKHQSATQMEKRPLLSWNMKKGHDTNLFLRSTAPLMFKAQQQSFVA